MTLLTFLYALLIIGFSLVFCGSVVISVMKVYYTRYSIYHNKETFEELLNVLSIIVSSELHEYEVSVFSSKGSITNKNYENFYFDITKKITDSISPVLVLKLTRYINEDRIYSIIARQVRDYLSEKVSVVPSK